MDCRKWTTSGNGLRYRLLAPRAGVDMAISVGSGKGWGGSIGAGAGAGAAVAEVPVGWAGTGVLSIGAPFTAPAEELIVVSGVLTPGTGVTETTGVAGVMGLMMLVGLIGTPGAGI